MLPSGQHLLASLLLFYFHLSQTLRLKPDLVFHFVFLLNSEIVLSFFHLILLLNHFGLLRLLLLLQHQGVLNFFLFIVPLLGHHVVVLAQLALLLILQLYVKNFLQNRVETCC
jgi:hypothetical protein